MSKWLSLGLAGVLSLLLLTSSAGATVLTPPVSLAPVTIGTVSGSVLADFTQTFNFGVGDTGSVEAAAVASTVNPFGSGDISFVFQFSVTGGLIEHLTDGSLLNALVDVEQAPSVTLAGTTFTTGTVLATSASRLTSDTVSFNFADGVFPGQTSYVLILNTNSTSFSPGVLGMIDAGAQQLTGFSVVPEPASATLLLAGLPFLAFGRWRRRK